LCQFLDILSLSFRKSPLYIQLAGFAGKPVVRPYPSPLNYLVQFSHFDFQTRQFMFSILNTTKMRKTIVILFVAIAVAASFTSCATTGGARSGCKMSQGYVGYR